MGISSERRPSAAFLAAGAVVAVLLGLTACSADGESPTRPSAAPSLERPATADPEPTDDPDAGATAATPRPTRTRETGAAPTPEPTRTTTKPTTKPTTKATTKPAAPTTTADRTPAETQTTTEETRPAEPTATATASAVPGTAVADTSDGLGAFGWFLLILLAAGLVGGVLIWRSRRKADWKTGAATLTADTRILLGTRLPAALATATAAQRALAWPPVRADLVDLMGRWALLPESAPGELQADWARQVWGLLQELVTAVDAENEALATGQQWRPLRLRVDDAGRALATTLSNGPVPGPDPSLA